MDHVDSDVVTQLMGRGVSMSHVKFRKCPCYIFLSLGSVHMYVLSKEMYTIAEPLFVMQYHTGHTSYDMSSFFSFLFGISFNILLDGKSVFQWKTVFVFNHKINPFKQIIIFQCESQAFHKFLKIKNKWR